MGSGAAGLTVALTAAGRGRRVLLLSKDGIGGGATPLAQGGLAAAIGPGDTPALHQRDTLDAGAGLCDPAAVATLVAEAPGRDRPPGRPRGPAGAHRAAPGGRAQPQPDRQRRGRRDRRGGAPGAARRPAGQPGPGPDPLCRAGRPDRRLRDGGRSGGRDRRPRRGPAARHGNRGRGRAGHRRLRPGLRDHHQPGRADRRRPGAGRPGRRGSCGTSSSCNSIRRCCGRKGPAVSAR